MTWLAHPYRVSPDNRTQVSDEAAHLRDMLELVLLTAPGERVRRPEFGCGVANLLFVGASSELARSVELTIQGAVQRWLGEVMTIEALSVSAEEATLRIDLVYRLRRTGERRSERLERPL